MCKLEREATLSVSVRGAALASITCPALSRYTLLARRITADRCLAILAHGGLRPGTNQRVLRKQTVAIVVAIMATCGMYNESGNYLVSTGMPAKSGVSGVIVAVVPGIAGVAVSSPRVNDKGGSVRGHMILRELSRQLGWHFALANASVHTAPPT